MIVSLRVGSSGGLDVPEDALSVFFALLNRDLMLTCEGDKLRVCCADGSKPEFTEAERAGIVRYKGHIIALVNYQPPAL